MERHKRTYTNLSDFIQRASVGINQHGEAVIVVDHVGDQPITLIGFTANRWLSEYEISELGYEYYLRLMEALQQLI